MTNEWLARAVRWYWKRTAPIEDDLKFTDGVERALNEREFHTRRWG